MSHEDERSKGTGSARRGNNHIQLINTSSPVHPPIIHHSSSYLLFRHARIQPLSGCRERYKHQTKGINIIQPNRSINPSTSIKRHPTTLLPTQPTLLCSGSIRQATANYWVARLVVTVPQRNWQLGATAGPRVPFSFWFSSFPSWAVRHPRHPDSSTPKTPSSQVKTKTISLTRTSSFHPQ